MYFFTLLLLSCLFPQTFTNTATRESLNTNFLSNLIASFRGPNTINITQFLTTLQLPECMKQCIPEIDGLLMAISNSNDTRDITEICSELQSSTNCASSVGCSKIFAEAAASAFQFVCLDNIQSISETVECVKNAALDIQPECEAHCEVQAKMIEDASNNNMEAIFDMPRVCNSTRCLLTCYKEKIDKKCQMGEQNLLDTLLRTVTHGEGKGVEEALGWVMPDYCKGNNSFKAINSGSSGRPLSVGKAASSTKQKQSKSSPKTKSGSKREQAPEKSFSMSGASGKKAAAGFTERTLVIDGEIRTLRYQLIDSQGHQVPSPDFDTLAKIMTQQFSTFSFPSNRPMETVILPAMRSGNDAEEQQKNSTESENEESLDLIGEAIHDWRSEDRSETSSDVVDVTKEGVGLTIGLVVFVATVIYWMWETARDMN
ncbi:hypothetical protein RB195_014259 [Necator americanus]